MPTILPAFRRSSVLRRWALEQLEAAICMPKHLPGFNNSAGKAFPRRWLSQSRRLGSTEEHFQSFVQRHIGPSLNDQAEMLKSLNPPVNSIEALVEETIPENIRCRDNLEVWETSADDLPPQAVPPFGKSEQAVQNAFRQIAAKNIVADSYIGMGYYGTVVPEVIKRNVLENPAWYTSYTPYQAEISQGRLESLLNFQTMVCDLTGLPVSNASLLDEATAAAEAMTMSVAGASSTKTTMASKRKTFVVSKNCHPQTIAVLRSRAQAFNVDIVIGDVLLDDSAIVKQAECLVGVLVQYPDTYGGIHDLTELSKVTHDKGALLSVATDLLALTILKAPGEFGADIAFGSAQRLGVPLAYGGPHAAFFACSQKLVRKVPGRMVGLSKDRLGQPAYRLALQTREQHIRRDKATSNICTAQALLANMSALYAVYHGPMGLKKIAERIARTTRHVQMRIEGANPDLKLATNGILEDSMVIFDTLAFSGPSEKIIDIRKRAKAKSINLRFEDDHTVAMSMHEGVTTDELNRLLACFNVPVETALASQVSNSSVEVPEQVRRNTPFLTHPVFNQHHSETELLRYIYHLQAKDLSLVHSMIPLGSCTMKLNGTTEMLSVTDPNFANIHPFAPREQSEGYRTIISSLSSNLARITGMSETSLQPNSGAQGEFAGLKVIKKYHASNGQPQRKICLIPVSAHGTNPASAAMAGMSVVPLKCDSEGNLDLQYLESMCKKHADDLAAIMITYPSTYGVFEPAIAEICDMVHQYGGQVYMDGANLNAQIGLCSPGGIGADVCHLNLHKTFCIPHGGGGPGVGPIAVKSHLAPFLPSHPVVNPQARIANSSSRQSSTTAIDPVSAAPWGSALILPISLSYLQLMGGAGLTHQTKVALLNANYVMSRLQGHYDILFTNRKGRCAHEFILDTRGFESVGIKAIDIAKRLQDYGFHAPTMSWPVPNTLMVEPTESESRVELDRFCDAMIEIRREIRDIEEGRAPREGNVLTLAPHPHADLLAEKWDRPYSREQAAYPLPWVKEKKFWPSVARVDDTYGDTNLFCTCPPVESPSE